jgi:hypothetical protein
MARRIIFVKVFDALSAAIRNSGYTAKQHRSLLLFVTRPCRLQKTPTDCADVRYIEAHTNGFHHCGDAMQVEAKAAFDPLTALAANEQRLVA